MLSVASRVLTKAIELQRSLTDKLKLAGFRLRDWTSNSSEFLNQLLESEKSKEEPISVLGLDWNQSKDTLQYRFDLAESPHTGTLRIAASMLASVYDPLGWISPCLLEFKLLIQDCWKAKLG